MQKLLQTMIEPLVDYPEEVKISKEAHRTSDTYHISVHPDDMGKIIGKHGRIAKAIRTIASSSEERKVFVEID